jgi:hypothetical protein
VPKKRHPASRKPSGRPPQGRQAQAAQARRGRQGKPARPLPPGDTFFTPGASAFRRAVERRAAVPMVMLARLPRWIPAAVMGGLIVCGIAIPGLVGLLCLIPVALFVLLLTYLSWPAITVSGKLIRVVTLAILVGFAAVQVTNI